MTVRIICIGAHPDDCEIEFGGAAYKFAAAGHAVKFLSVTNGAAGHHVHPAEELVAVRKTKPRRPRDAWGWPRPKSWVITTASCCRRWTLGRKSCAAFAAGMRTLF